MNVRRIGRRTTGLLFLVTILALVVLSGRQAFAQSDAEILRSAERMPYWVNLMRDRNAKLSTVQQAFEKHFANKKQQRGNGFKPFKRWEYWMLNRVAPDGARPPEGAVTKALATFHSKQTRTPGPAVWKVLGPTDVSPDNGRGLLGMGRLNGITFHPREPNTIFVASAGGGLWKTTDGGASWKSLTDSLPVLSTSVLAIDPRDPQALYLGTGDIEVGMSVAMGVFKSTDGGATWTASNAGIEDRTVGSILIHPSDSKRLLAGTDMGVFLSTDSGASWAASSPECYVAEMVAKPGDPSTVYASANGYFLRSGDAGASWQVIQGVMPQAYMAIGVSMAAPEVVYVLLGDLQTLSFAGFYRSTDSGRTFIKQSASPNILGWETDGSDDSGQAFYDLCVTADPRRPEVVYIGGINVWRSQDSGRTWAIAGYWRGTGGFPGIHADHHFLAFSPHDNSIFSANDGGLHRYNGAANEWRDLSSGLGIAMIYRSGNTPASPAQVIAGFQDNGFKLLAGEWTNLRGGDGMEVVAAPDDANFLLGVTYYGWVFRSFDRGATLEEGIGPKEEGGWVSPFFLDGKNPRRAYIGLCDVWRTADIRAKPVSWQKITALPAPTDPAPVKRKLCTVVQSQVDPDLMFAAREDYRVWRTRNATAAAPQWEDITTKLPLSARANAMACSRRDAATVYLAANGRIYKSTDRGGAWKDITGAMPVIATYCLYHDDVGRMVYAGTDFGVFYRPDDDSGDWTAYNAGMPVVPVYDLDLFATQQAPQSRILRAATYGRGLWEAVPAARSDTVPDAVPGKTNITAMLTKVTPPRTDTSVQSLSIARRESFPFPLPDGNADVLVGEGPDPAKADLLLRISGNQVGVYFEGKWMNAGTLGSVPRTMGKSVHLESAVRRDGEVTLTFSHSLDAGKTRTIYVRVGEGEWQSRLTVSAKE